MGVLMGLLAVTGAIVWLWILATLLRPLTFATAATVSVWRCWRAVYRINDLRVPFHHTFRGMGRVFADFWRSPVPGNLKMGSEQFQWRGIGDWTVYRTPTAPDEAAA